MRARARGISLAVVLVVSGMALTMAFCLAGTTFFHLNASTVQIDARRAHLLAESAVNRAIYALMDDPSYGTRNKAAETIEVPGTDGEARLTFHEDTARRLGIPWSTNALASEESQDGWNDAVVPGSTARLVGTGTSNGQTRRIEAIVHMPQWPFTIGTRGSFESAGGLLVAAAPEGTHSLSAPSTPEDQRRVFRIGDLAPGDLFSNASVKLGPGSTVTGDVASAGGVDLAADVRVLGEVRPDSGVTEIPEVDPRSASGC